MLESNVVLQGIRIRVHNPGCEHYPHYPHFEGNFDQLPVSTLSLRTGNYFEKYEYCMDVPGKKKYQESSVTVSCHYVKNT